MAKAGLGFELLQFGYSTLYFSKYKSINVVDFYLSESPL